MEVTPRCQGNVKLNVTHLNHAKTNKFYRKGVVYHWARRFHGRHLLESSLNFFHCKVPNQFVIHLSYYYSRNNLHHFASKLSRFAKVKWSV